MNVAVYESAVRTMEVYDALPREVRDELKETPSNESVVATLGTSLVKGMPIKAAAKFVRAHRQAAMAEYRRKFGL